MSQASLGRLPRHAHGPCFLIPDPCDKDCPKDFKKQARELLPVVLGQVREGDEKLRKALLKFIADFSNWDNASNPTFLEIGRGLVKAANVEETPLVADPGSGELIKPWLRGRDIKKWKAEWAGLYVISIASSANREWPWSNEKTEAKAESLFEKIHPTIYKHLSQRRNELKKRDDQGKFWWELRSCAYYEEFERPKIIYPDISQHSKFTWDESNSFLGNTAYIIPTGEKWLVGLLNSKLIWWFYLNLSSIIRGGFVRFIAQYMEQLPISPAAPAQKAPIIERVQAILSNPGNPDIPRLEAEIDQLVYGLYGLTEEEIGIVERMR